jgi:tetratricopeptide (TPR) repeat protein
MMLGKTKEQIADLDHAIAAHPDAEFYSERAKALMNTGAPPDRVMADISQALQLEPNNPLAHLDRSELNLHIGKYTDALTDATWVEAHTEDRPSLLATAHLDAALSLIYLNDNDNALKKIKQCLALDPEYKRCQHFHDKLVQSGATEQ